MMEIITNKKSLELSLPNDIVGGGKFLNVHNDEGFGRFSGVREGVGVVCHGEKKN